jgi:hypothetical protein
MSLQIKTLQFLKRQKQRCVENPIAQAEIPSTPKREPDHSSFGGITHDPRPHTTITAQVFRQLWLVWVLVHDGDDGYNDVFRQQNFQFL